MSTAATAGTGNLRKKMWYATNPAGVVCVLFLLLHRKTTALLFVDPVTDLVEVAFDFDDGGDSMNGKECSCLTHTSSAEHETTFKLVPTTTV